MLFPTPSRAALGALLALLGVLSAAPAAAIPGDGELQDGELDLLVYFTYPETDPRDWIPVFEAYSELLLNATEGGVQLGRVQFTRCPSLADEADVWVLDDFSGARAHIGGLGRSGQHITISQTHRSSSGGALGQFGLTHETGHYVWSLYDEYLGFVGGSSARSELHYCSTSSGDVACLMDGGTTVFPNNQRTEFCTDGGAGFFLSTHNTGVVDVMGRAVVTDQEYVHGRSCWSQIERDGAGGLQHPATAPQDHVQGHESVEFDLDRYLGPLTMALLIDTSGSMSGDRRLEGAILGAQLALAMLRDGETQAVWSFDDRLRTVRSPQTVTASRREAAIEAVGELTAGGGTRAGEALFEVAEALHDVDGCRRFVVLLTDGVSEQPDVDEAEVLYELQGNDVLVFPVALGSFPDDAALLELAQATGGQYFHAADPADLPDVFAQIFALAGGGTNVGTVDGPGGLLPGEWLTLDLEVSEGADALVVALSAASAGAPRLELSGPRGERVRADAPPQGVALVDAGDVLLLRIPAPSAGAWRAVATVEEGVPEASLHAVVEAAALSVVATAEEPRLGPNEAAALEVSVVNRVPVDGARVAGELVEPSGARLPIVLADDGHPASGDRVAGDGVYAARFVPRGGPGVYRAELTVVNVDGVAASNRECGVYGAALVDGVLREDGSEATAVAPFRARTSQAFLLEEDGGPPRTGALELRQHPRAAAPERDGALAFCLDVAPTEPVVLERLALRVGAASASLDGFELHLDRDLDGLIDRPRRPLARARAAAHTLRLERAEGPLALLAAGETVGFLLVAPAGVSAAGPAGGSLTGILPPRVPPGPPALAAVALAALACAALAAGRRRRLRPTATGALLLVGLASIGLACASAAGEAAPTALLDPGDVRGAGARTGDAVPVLGPELELAVRLEAP